MATLETTVCSITVNRLVRTRTLGGVGAGGYPSPSRSIGKSAASRSSCCPRQPPQPGL